jgi:hypothetical protein
LGNVTMPSVAAISVRLCAAVNDVTITARRRHVATANISVKMKST